MRKINNYIIEKLKLNKDTKEDNNIYDDIRNKIDEYLKMFNNNYAVSFEHSNEEEIYIVIYFSQRLNNNVIHNIGLGIFKMIYDEDKFKKYNQGTDWWISSQSQIVFKFEYK